MALALAIPAAIAIAGMFMNKSNSDDASDSAKQDYQQSGNVLPSYYNPYINMGQWAQGDLMGQYGGLGTMQDQMMEQSQQLMRGGPQLQDQYSTLMNGLPQLQQQYQSLTGMLPTIQSQYGAMATDPGGYINHVGQSFHQSPGYAFQTQQATNAANQAAAAGGMVGSPQEQQNLAGSINGIANQDYYNYLGQAMNANQTGLGQMTGMYDMGLQGQQNLYGMGLQGAQGMYNTGLGMGENLYGMGLQGLQGMDNMGFTGATGLGNSFSNMYQQQGMNSYAGAANQNASNNGQMGMMMQMIPAIMAAMSKQNNGSIPATSTPATT